MGDLELARPTNGVDPVAMTQDSPNAINARANGASIVQVQLGADKWLMVALWISTLISGIAIAGLIATAMFIRANIGYTAVLEYDLMDLRAKTGYAHENTVEPEQDN